MRQVIGRLAVFVVCLLFAAAGLVVATGPSPWHPVLGIAAAGVSAAAILSAPVDAVRHILRDRQPAPSDADGEPHDL